MELTHDFNIPLSSFESTCPLLLNNEQVNDPYLMVESFFSFDTLAGHKRRLKAWYQHAMIEGECADEPGEYLFMHNQFVQLLQASYLISSVNIKYHRHERRKINGLCFSEWLIKVKQNHLYTGQFSQEEFRTTYLSLAYMNNTHQYLSDFASLSNIKQMRYGLLEWLYSALSNKSSITGLSKEYLFGQFVQLNRLIEAFYLILIKEI